MTTTRKKATLDPDLELIETWHRFMRDGHKARFAELNLPHEQHDRELRDCLATVDAVAAQLREDLFARRRAAQEATRG